MPTVEMNELLITTVVLNATGLVFMITFYVIYQEAKNKVLHSI